MLSSELRKITKLKKEEGLFLWQRQMLLNMDLKIKKKVGLKGGISKKQTKFQGKCLNCDKMSHNASDCRLPKKKREANVVENITQHVSNINLSAVVSEVNLVSSNMREWWIDTGATRHVYSDKGLFTSFEAVNNGEKLFMGNSTTSEIEGQGKVILKMTSRK